MKIIIRKGGKGSIVTIMSPEFYLNMCNEHFSITEYYEKVIYNPKTILQEKVDDFIRKYKVGSNR